jgi:hypothetical protein
VTAIERFVVLIYFVCLIGGAVSAVLFVPWLMR